MPGSSPSPAAAKSGAPESKPPETPDQTFLLEGLSPADRQSVMAASERRVFARHDVLVPIGDEYREVYCLLSGSAAVLAEDERLVAVLGPGDTFGEIGFLRRVRRTANVVAQSDGEVLVISADAFERFMAEEPQIAARMLLNLSRELAARLALTTEMALL